MLSLFSPHLEGSFGVQWVMVPDQFNFEQNMDYFFKVEIQLAE